MKTDKKTIYGKTLLLISMIILFMNTIFAFAVSSAYHPDNPLYIPPGETTEGYITLQNLAGESDVNIRAEIMSGSEILELTDPSNEYLVPAGEKTIVNYKITIPSDAKIDDVYPINIVFTTITEGGGFSFGSSIGQKFNVIVGSGAKPPEEGIPSWTIGLIIGAIILITIIIILTKRKKKKK